MTDPDHLYLRVKTLNDSFLVDVGADPTAARVALARAKELMEETGAVTIAEGLVVNASDIESIVLQDGENASQ
jgi:hypothetical protein